MALNLFSRILGLLQFPTRCRPPRRACFQRTSPGLLSLELLEARTLLSGVTLAATSARPLTPGSVSVVAARTGPLQAPLDVGAGPNSVVVADINGDGFPDIVTANDGDDTVSVLLGNGDGSFQAQRSFHLDGRPFTMAVADVNGDGRPDVVIAAAANSYTSTVSVLLGNGDGTFQAERSFPLDAGPYSMAVADVNGDGWPDLVFHGYNTVSVLLSNGNASFQALQTFPVGLGGIAALAVADINGDGRPDLITGNDRNFFTPGFTLGSSVGVLLGNGDGTFQAPQTFSVTFRDLTALAVADMNGDGRPDLVTLGLDFQENPIGLEKVDVLLGNGNGSFQAPQSPQDTLGVGAIAALAVADVNGDGRPDLVTAKFLGGTVSVLLGNGDGSFQERETLGVGRTTALAVADVNGDGQPDLVTADSFNNTVSLFLNNGHGEFEGQEFFQLGSYPVGVSAADVNGDGRPDLILGNGGTFFSPESGVSVSLGNGDGSFQPQRSFPVAPTLLTLAVADINGDGRPDLVTTNRAADPADWIDKGTVSVLLGNGDGSFQTPQSFPVDAVPYSQVVADINGDGFPDLVTANADPNGSNNGTVSVLRGNGDGSFQAPQSFSVAPNILAMAVADINGDGFPDLVTANTDPNGFDKGTVSVLLGNGDGSFQPQESFPVGAHPSAVAVADINGDGRPDLITTNFGDDTVSVLLGHGGDSFLPQQTFGVGRYPEDVIVGDWNGDGRPDLAITNLFDDVSVALGNGDGTFQPVRRYAVGGGPTRLIAIDLNGDRLPDLAIVNSLSDNLSVLFGIGDGTFSYLSGIVPTIVTPIESNPSPSPPPGSVRAQDIGELKPLSSSAVPVVAVLSTGTSAFQPSVVHQAISTGGGNQPATSTVRYHFRDVAARGRGPGCARGGGN